MLVRHRHTKLTQLLREPVHLRILDLDQQSAACAQAVDHRTVEHRRLVPINVDFQVFRRGKAELRAPAIEVNELDRMYVLRLKRVTGHRRWLAYDLLVRAKLHLPNVKPVDGEAVGSSHVECLNIDAAARIEKRVPRKQEIVRRIRLDRNHFQAALRGVQREDSVTRAEIVVDRRRRQTVDPFEQGRWSGRTELRRTNEILKPASALFCPVRT